MLSLSCNVKETVSPPSPKLWRFADHLINRGRCSFSPRAQQKNSFNKRVLLLLLLQLGKNFNHCSPDSIDVLHRAKRSGRLTSRSVISISALIVLQQAVPVLGLNCRSDLNRAAAGLSMSFLLGKASAYRLFTELGNGVFSNWSSANRFRRRIVIAEFSSDVAFCRGPFLPVNVSVPNRATAAAESVKRLSKVDSPAFFSCFE